MTTGDRIRSARKAAGMTQSELAERVGVKFSAIHKYETNMVVNLKRETIAALAEALGVSPAWLMCLEEQPTAGMREIDPIFDALNEAGQRELCRYGRYLGTRADYRALERGEIVPFGPPIPHFLTAAAAGYAAPIEGQDYEMVERDANTPVGADFCIDIDGDSMEPYIRSGERVYVKSGSTGLREFDVGIFFVDGDVLCKQWCLDYAGTLHLLSANPRREDANRSFPKSSGQNVVCLGRVLLPHRLPQPTYE